MIIHEYIVSSYIFVLRNDIVDIFKVQKWMAKAEEIKTYLEVKKLNANENNSVEKDQQEEAAEKSILNSGK